ncbi:lysophospholipase [Bombiscardovia nodaiensis]|uniref:Lysophospholipase n=1 Tax=Bombiscardovia nodaiensis TaxID=2932181 RepID=A0ABM8B5P7_9BIFI|nr:lysophospholipase [Bombiscardovia nodaiensis]
MDVELIDEGQYEQTMRETVLPALERCKREGWMRSHNPSAVGAESAAGASSVKSAASASPSPSPSPSDDRLVQGAATGAPVGVDLAAAEGPDRLHFVCYEAARFDELALPGSQGRHRGVVIISHGFTEFAGKYSEMAWYFLMAGYTVCILEHWGHGLSGRGLSDPNLVWVDSYERYVDDLAAFCEEMAADYGGDQPVCLYAHSMGAGIAAALLERHPMLIDRAVLSSPMIAPKTGLPLPVTTAAVGAACALGMSQDKVPFHHRFDPSAEPADADAGNASLPRLRWVHAQRAANRAYQTSAATYGWVQQAIALSRDLLKPAHCDQVEAASLVFQASPDTFVLPKPQDRFVDQVRTGGSEATLVRVPRSTHELYTMPNAALGPYLKQILTFFAEPYSLSSEAM